MPFTKDCYVSLSNHCGVFLAKENVGLVWSGDDIYLFDSGKSYSDGQSLVKAISELVFLKGKRVKTVINTHGHFDHCGGNPAVRDLTGCTVWASKTEAAVIENPVLALGAYWDETKFASVKEPVLNGGSGSKVDSIIEEVFVDNKFYTDDLIFTSVSLPGHSYAQCGFVVEEKESGKTVFYTGDGLFSKELIRRYWIPFMQDEEGFRNSVEKILDYEADYYVPGHGKPCPKNSISSLVEMNIIITLEAEALVKNILTKGPATEEFILKNVAEFAGIPFNVKQYMLIGITIRSHLSCLAARGEVVYYFEGSRLFWALPDTLKVKVASKN